MCCDFEALEFMVEFIGVGKLVKPQNAYDDCSGEQCIILPLVNARGIFPCPTGRQRAFLEGLGFGKRAF
jgi:hypothetical protein